MHELKWSKSEKAEARQAFEKAYQREYESLTRQVQKKAEQISTSQDLWRLHDFLGKKRKEIDRKYDYRYSVLILVFARLMQEGWLEEEDLIGIGEDKMAKIITVVKIGS